MTPHAMSGVEPCLGPTVFLFPQGIPSYSALKLPSPPLCNRILGLLQGGNCSWTAAPVLNWKVTLHCPLESIWT